MSIQPIPYLKSLFTCGKKPTQKDFTDLIDTLYQKLHRRTHHSYPSIGDDFSGTDPIASSTDPFIGDFCLQGSLSACSPVSAYAGVFESNNTALCAIGGTTGLAVSGGVYGIYAHGVSQDTGNIMISSWQSPPVFPDISQPAIYVDGSLVVTKAISADSLWVTQLYSASSVLKVIDMSITEVSGLIINGSDYNPNVPIIFDPLTQQGLTLSGIGLTGTSWGSFGGDLQVGGNINTIGAITAQTIDFTSASTLVTDVTATGVYVSLFINGSALAIPLYKHT